MPTEDAGRSAPPEKIFAPWTPEQVDALNRWQRAGTVHPFTHDCGTVLRATPEGWRCDDIGCPETDEELDQHPRVVQNWAHAFMVEEPPAPFDFSAAPPPPSADAPRAEAPPEREPHSEDLCRCGKPRREHDFGYSASRCRFSLAPAGALPVPEGAPRPTLDERMRDLHDRLMSEGRDTDASVLDEAAWAIDGLETDVELARYPATRGAPEGDELQAMIERLRQEARYAAVESNFDGDCKPEDYLWWKAADALASLTAERDALRRDRDWTQEQCNAAQDDYEAAEARAARARTDALEEAARIADAEANSREGTWWESPTNTAINTARGLAKRIRALAGEEGGKHVG
jgi:hypothetical protein